MDVPIPEARPIQRGRWRLQVEGSKSPGTDSVLPEMLQYGE